KELVDVHAQALDRNAMLAEMLAGVLEMLGRLQQGFRRNAAHVGAGTARCGAALGIAPGIDASNRLPELGSTNRSDVAAGAGANHHYVKLFGHLMISSKLVNAVWQSMPCQGVAGRLRGRATGAAD